MLASSGLVTFFFLFKLFTLKNLRNYKLIFIVKFLIFFYFLFFFHLILNSQISYVLEKKFNKIKINPYLSRVDSLKKDKIIQIYKILTEGGIVKLRQRCYGAMASK